MSILTTAKATGVEFDYEPQSVEGKCVLISGGTTGIGRTTALMLADRGAKVMIFGRHKKELRDALADLCQDGRQVHGAIADQSSIEEVQRVFREADKTLGGLDILVNNAGLAADGVDDTSLDQIQYVFRTNLLGYVACAKEAVVRMKKKGGHIVLIGSMSAESRSGESTVYVATKAGVQGFAEALRKEVAKMGIKVSLIEPGKVGSDMQPRKWSHARQAERQKMLKGEDIAACVYYCVTQPARCDVIEVRIQPHKQED